MDKIEISLLDEQENSISVWVDVSNSSLTEKWLTSLNHLLNNSYHLEKNYCFHGFDGFRDSKYIINEINKSTEAINSSSLDYYIDDHFSIENTIVPGIPAEGSDAGKIVHEKTNQLHHYFEELQGTSGTGGQISNYYNQADSETRWHIRQLNLLCHELESCILSERKRQYLPEWQRPSQLMCWLNAPRFTLDEKDYELFGIETINRSLGGVYVGVNKAVGKHHWEVFCDEEGRSIDELTTISMRSQTQAAGDFDIEWANNPGNFHWQKTHLKNFRKWLIDNNFDPEDKSLTIGHPQVGKVDLQKSFGTDDYRVIWKILNNYLNVSSIKTSDAYAEFPYKWSDNDYMEQQIRSVA
jgi:hypothetical protein